MTSDQSAAPLQGLRVIDMTSLIMGPLSCQILGDYGADVIKLEPLTGELFRAAQPQGSSGMSHTFIQLNRNKRSLALDLKAKGSREVMQRLVKTSDVVISNLRPSAQKTLGVDYASLKAIKPDIIACSAYGYSEQGPYAGRPAAEDTIQAMSGMADLQRTATSTQQFVATALADKVTGLALVNAVMAAVIHRMKTGQGQAIEVPMFETMVAFVMVEHLAGYTFNPPKGETGYTRITDPMRKPYATKDGYISVLPYTTAQWLRFFRLIGRDDLAEDKALADPAERYRRFAELFAIINDAMPARTTQEWVDALLENDILFGKVNSPKDLLTDPHLVARNMFPTVEHPTEGTLRMVGFPINFSETPNKLARLPPKLGQHSREILTELGFDSDEIHTLERDKVVVDFDRSEAAAG